MGPFNYFTGPAPPRVQYFVMSNNNKKPTTPTYSIVKYRFNKPPRVLHRGYALADAKVYCNRPDTEGNGWFCGFTREQ